MSEYMLFPRGIARDGRRNVDSSPILHLTPENHKRDLARVRAGGDPAMIRTSEKLLVTQPRHAVRRHVEVSPPWCRDCTKRYLEVDESSEGNDIVVGCRFCPGYSGYDVSRKAYQQAHMNNGRPCGAQIQQLQTQNEMAHGGTFHPASQHQTHIGIVAHDTKARSASDSGVRNDGLSGQDESAMGAGNDISRMRATSLPVERLTMRQEWDEQRRQRHEQEMETKAQDQVNQRAVLEAQHQLDTILYAKEQRRMKYGTS